MKYLSFLFLCIVLVACKKETVELETQVIEIGTANDIYDLVFVDDTLAFACGGNLWEDGFIAKSVDGGNSWNIVYDHFNILYKLEFKNYQEGVAAGFWGGILKTFDGGNSWTFLEYPDNGGSNNDLKFVSDSIILFAAGTSYHFGGVMRYNFYDDSFTFDDRSQTFESLHMFNDQEGLLGAYGVIYTTSDGGKNIQATNASGDFFKDISFSGDNGVAVGFQGRIMTSNTKGNYWSQSKKRASFFTTKGNLEGVSVFNQSAFICGENGTLLYAENFQSSWADVIHPYHQDLLCVYLKSENEGYVTGRNGLMFKFWY